MPAVIDTPFPRGATFAKFRQDRLFQWVHCGSQRAVRQGDVLQIVSQTGRFRAASSGAGISNLASFAGTSDLLGFVPGYLDGLPWESSRIYVERSPLFQLTGATTPTLIQHGGNDARVPLSQSFELYHGLKRLGVETEMVIYPGQGQGISDPALLLDAARRNLEWFERHLLDGS